MQRGGKKKTPKIKQHQKQNKTQEPKSIRIKGNKCRKEKGGKKPIAPKRHIIVPEIENSTNWDKNAFQSY